MPKAAFAVAPLLACLGLAACASNPASADSAQVAAAKQVYEDCLRNAAAQFDDGSSDPDAAGISLAGYCLQEFSRYRALSGVDPGVNESIATRVIIRRRRL